MIQIYLDGNLLDDDNYIGFSYERSIFQDNFYLGSTSSKQASLVIPKDALPSNLQNVLVKINGNNYLNLVVDNIDINDNNEAQITLTDKLVNLNVNYDISANVPITAKNLLNKICTDFNISHDIFSFTNDSVSIDSYDDRLTARDYLSMIAELAGGYAEIDNDGKLKIKYYSNNNITNEITTEDIDSYKLGEPFTIERVVYEFGAIHKESSSDDTLNTIYLDSNNMFLQVMTDSQFSALCNNIIGFTFYNIQIPNCNVFYVDNNYLNLIGLDNETYTILNEFSTDYFGNFVGNYKSEIKNSKQEITKILSPSQNIKRLSIEVDQANNTITQLATKTEQLEESIEVLKADLDTNIAIVSVNEENKPFDNKTYEIDYSIKYLGEPLLTGYTITTQDSHTGITTDLTTLGKLKFTVATNTAIPSSDNKYTFVFSYTYDGTTFTSIRSVMISTLSSEVEQTVIISALEPSDTSVLWYDTEDDILKSYDEDAHIWKEVNNSDSQIQEVRDLITGSDGLQNKYDELETRINNAENDISNKVDNAIFDNYKTEVARIQGDYYTKDEIKQIANGVGTDGVTVTAVISTSATFDKDGMHYQKSTSDTVSTINQEGLAVNDSIGNELFFAGVRTGESSSIVQTSNLKSDTYIIFGQEKGRLQEFVDPESHLDGIGLFLL